jgi:catechol 2,3-dioxygenase-like lactoylglutathione lyase family enzyme
MNTLYHRASLVLLLLWLPVAIAAKAPFAAVQGGYIALSVADLDASAKWYADTFDLKIAKQRSQSPDKKAVATILTGNGLIVELVQHAEAMALRAAAPALSRAFQIHGIFKAGVVVDDLDAAFQELEARKVDIAFRVFNDNALAYRTFAIRDNSGNMIQFFGK